MALYLLRSLTADECRLASSISRCLISHVNSRDNSGVLAGSNGGSHMGGTHPCRWTGSTTILSKYYRTKSPVRYDIGMAHVYCSGTLSTPYICRYGQCWVFSGVAISMMRALGIASRPVTCYNAAHCVQKLGHVNCYFSTAGELEHTIGKDRIWLVGWVGGWVRIYVCSMSGCTMCGVRHG